MTPVAKVSRTSTAGPLVRADAGLVLAAVYLGIGIAGYLLAGQDATGGSLPVLWTAIAITAGSAVVLRRPNPLPASVARWVCPALVGPIALYPLFAPVLGLEIPVLTSLAGALLLTATLPMVLAIARLPPATAATSRAPLCPRIALAAALLILVRVASFEPLASPVVATDPMLGSAAGWVARLLVIANPCMATGGGIHRPAASRAEPGSPTC